MTHPGTSRWLLLAAALLVLAVPPVAAQEAGDAPAAGERTWYAATIAQGEGGFLVTHFWSRGARFRSETVVKGHRITTIVNGPTYYTIDMVSGEGIAIGRSDLAIANDATRGRSFGDEYDMIVKSGGEKIGEEEKGGQLCDVYRLTNDAGRIQIWVTQSGKLPVRVDRYVRESGLREFLDYVNWRAGLPIDDGFFEPEPRIRLERVSYEEYVRNSMTKRMGPAPPLYGHLLHGETN